MNLVLKFVLGRQYIFLKFSMDRNLKHYSGEISLCYLYNQAPVLLCRKKKKNMGSIQQPQFLIPING